jgi:DHA1 family tetracycline resistance protein-like MFS transporter
MAETPKPSRAAFGFLLITMVLDTLTFGITAPVLPTLLVELQGGSIAGAAGILGVFGTAWAVMQFVASPILGSLSDRYGRRPVLLISMSGLGLDFVLMALAPNVMWLFVGRVLSGVTTASFPTAMAYVADTTAEDKRAERFGLLGAAFGFGFIIGPAFGGFLAGFDVRAPFWCAAALCLLNAIFGFFILPESLPKERRSPFKWRNANFFGSLSLLRATPVLLAIGLAMFFVRLALDVNPAIIVIYTQTRYGWDAQDVGLMLATYGACSMFVQALLIGPIIKRLGERRALMFGLTCGAVAFSFYALAPKGWIFLIGLPIGALFGLAIAAMQGIATRAVESTNQGQLQGALASLTSIAAIIAPLMFTQAFALGISITTIQGAVGLPYVLSVLFFVFALLLALRLPKLK